MLLLELVRILSFLITCFVLVVLDRSIRMLIKCHDYRENVDETVKTFSQFTVLVNCIKFEEKKFGVLGYDKLT